MGHLISKLGGNFRGEPGELFEDGGLSEGARQLLDDVFKDMDCSKIVDYHTHVVGRGTEGTHCSVHYSMFNGINFLQRIKARIFLSASGGTITDMDSAFTQRLKALIQNSCRHPAEQFQTPVHGRNLLLAFDHVYDKDNELQENQSSIYTPNDYVMDIAEEHPEHFLAACSVHPFRSDMEAELKRCHAKGVRIVKWLPNVMGFSPADKQCDAFYDVVKELDMAILCHVGDEHSLTAGVLDNDNGNPLHLQKALDRGVKVIMAHCATEGHYRHPESNESVPGIEIFLYLMDMEKYKSVLFGDISAITAWRRAKHIQTLIEREDIHNRLVFGSDYPVPAISIVTSTKLLAWYGLISWQDSGYLNEIYSYNPLLYDIAVKRRMKSPSTNRGFADCIFQEHPLLPPCGEPTSPPC